jgi:hypothetical protein
VFLSGAMNVRAGCLADYFIPVIHNIKYFVIHYLKRVS